MTSPDPTHCGAITRSREGTCRHEAGWGTPHPGIGRCRLHGGNSPSAVRSAATQLAEREVRRTLEALGGAAPITNPLGELLRIAGESLAWMNVARQHAAALVDDGDLTTITDAGEEVRAMVRVYERAMDRTAGVLARVAALKVDERLTVITQRDLERLRAAVDVAWAAGRDGRDVESARAEAAARLRVT